MPFDLSFIVKEAVKLAKATKERPLYLFLDELVYAEKWELWLKTFYDEHWPVNIIASSSATAALQRGKESGVGRWEDFHLAPYLLTELLQLYNKDIKCPAYKKKPCLNDTIESLSQTLSHTQLNFEDERKLLISLGGFPEFLAGKKREKDTFLWNIKKEVEKNLSEIEKLEKRLQNKKTKFIKMNLTDKLHEIKKIEKEIFTVKENIGLEFQKEYMDIQFVKEDDYFYKVQQKLRSDAIERAIYKDIPQSYRIDSPLTLERLLYVLAGQVTGLLSLKGIGQDIPQASMHTLDRYLNYLIQTYLVFTLSNYDSNERNVQRRQKKLYFVDSCNEKFSFTKK